MSTMVKQNLLKGRVKRRSSISRSHIPYVAPAMAIMIMLTGLPIIAVLALSFTNYELAIPLGQLRWIGLRNYERLFFGHNRVFYYSIAISIGMMVVATAFQMVLGFAAASLLNQNIRFKALVVACLIVPIAITPSIASQIWKLMLNAEFGVINFLLDRFFGTTVVWLGPDHAMLSVFIVNIWIMTPFVTLILYGGLTSLPLEPFESADIDGANAVQKLFRITLPMLKPLILLTILFRSIDMLRMFDIPFVLTHGGPGNITEFIGVHIWRIGFGVNSRIGQASAVSVVLLIIVSVISLVLIKLMGRKED